jgi:hypothetical protein
MASDMERLAERSDDARRAFVEVRDQTEARLRVDPSWDDLNDWVVLNEVIGDAAATLAWVDRNKGDEEGVKTLRRFDYRILSLLEEEGRWADYGLVVDDPVATVRRYHDTFLRAADLDDGAPGLEEELAESRRQHFRSSVASIHAGLLAAQREDEAWRVVEVATGLANDPALNSAVVEKALEVGQPRERHREMLGAESDASLRRRLAEALGA